MCLFRKDQLYFLIKESKAKQILITLYSTFTK